MSRPVFPRATRVVAALLLLVGLLAIPATASADRGTPDRRPKPTVVLVCGSWP